jgi:hypothetical protein
MRTRLQLIRDESNIWFYSEKSDEEIKEKTKQLEHDWNGHKFRRGEYYDRYLSALLNKYCLTLAEYRAGKELLTGGRES